MKSLAEQSVPELGGRLSVLHRQKRDHVKLDRLLHRLAEASPPEQARVLRKIYRLVFPHAFAEEALLWPVIRRVLPDGHALTLRVEQEHQAINELVTRLEALAPGSAAHEVVLAQVVDLLSQDVRDEEDALLPRLQDRLSLNQLRLLGVAWEAVRQIAPTRAHPIVSRRPPGNVLSALPLALVDRCRDLVDGLIDGGPDAAAAPLRALSAGLTATSHGIERLPGLRRGEDPSTRIGRRSRGGWAVVAVAALAAGAAALKLSQRKRASA
ncbi:MAG TPA: hemerythrin domain-containing protein [Allosphingosinicella sp.]